MRLICVSPYFRSIPGNVGHILHDRLHYNSFIIYIRETPFFLKTVSVKMHFVVSVVSETLKNKELQYLTHPMTAGEEIRYSGKMIVLEKQLG